MRALKRALTSARQRERMKPIILLLGLCLSLPSVSAHAGAWPRGQGNSFVSLSYEWSADQEHSGAVMSGSVTDIPSQDFVSLFAEYGLTDRLTVGLDHGYGGPGDTYQSIGFAVLALSPDEFAHKIAAEFGIGERNFREDAFDRGTLADIRPGGTELILRPGVSWGYGFVSPLGNAWATATARMEFRRDRDETVRKLDATVGVTLNERNAAHVQAQWSDYPDAAPNLRLVPGHIFRLRKGLSLDTSILWDVDGGDRFGLKSGLWLEF